MEERNGICAVDVHGCPSSAWASTVGGSIDGLLCGPMLGKAAMRFPTRLTVFCCVSLAIVCSSAAIVHSHRKKHSYHGTCW